MEDDTAAAITSSSSSRNGSIQHASSSDSGFSARSLCTLRVQVLSARGLAAKDRNGKSDPFVVVSLPGSADTGRTITTVKPKTLEPEWNAEEATFEYPVLPDWFGPSFATVASDQVNTDVVRAALQNATGHEHQVDALSASIGSRRSRLTLRSASTKMISGAATKILVAPVKLGAAGARVVGRQMPRPMRIKRRIPFSASSQSSDIVSDPDRSPDTTRQDRPNRGSIQLDASNATVSGLEFVIWDKDRFSGDDYMGECSLLVPQWCSESQVEWSKAQPRWLPVESSRPDAKISGELQVKVGFLPNSSPSNVLAASPLNSGPQSWDVDQVYHRLVLATLDSTGAAVRAVPASQSVGMTRATDAFVDDGLSSDSDEEADEEDEEIVSDYDTASGTSDLNDDDINDLETDLDDDGIYEQHYQSIVGVSSQPSSATTGTEALPLPLPNTVQQGGGKYRRIFSRHRTFKSAQNSGTNTPYTASGSELDRPGAITPLESSVDENSKTPRRRRRLPGVRRRGAQVEGANIVTQTRRTRHSKIRKYPTNRSPGDYAFKAEMGMDIIGIVMMEIKGANNLPRWSNVTRTGFDMDPFAIISFGQKIFRTRVVRHTLNPTWNEKLLFHVRRHETKFQAKFMIYDWDRMSSNDYVGGAQLAIADLVDAAPKPDPSTGLYSADEDGVHSMKEFALPLSRIEKDEEIKFRGAGRPPTVVLEAKFTPYDALRQRFWRQLAQQFDTNDSGTLSRLELSSMLDSLGSTLSPKTLESYFLELGKDPEEDELTFNETIMALEAEVKKPWDLKRKAAPQSVPDSGSETPALLGAVADIGTEINQPFDFSGSNAPILAEDVRGHFDRPVPSPAEITANEPKDKPFSGVSLISTSPAGKLDRNLSALSISSCTSSALSSTLAKGQAEAGTDAGSINMPSSEIAGVPKTRTVSRSSSDKLSMVQTPPVIKIEGDEYDETQTMERVARLQSCPLCHMPRLSKKGEMDIITHLAVCASQDWRRVESLTVRNYVTASQAHRKWYTKIVNKISQGNYQLGANSANIIVQDRISGELMEEKMQVYVRLGIRLLYQGAQSRMEGARIKRMLKNMSVKQGVKFDSPSSAREIPTFIAFHSLNTDEIRNPLDSFKTFNEFFYRELKSDARPNDEPDNPSRLVSGADCRMMAFESISEATQIWIKGRDFTVERLLGEAAKEVDSLENYQNGGSLAIFRLAPQDYHRFHCPADATVGNFTWIDGQYYTVNPMAIRSGIDVYGENIRVIVPFHSAAFGTFYAVCIGAMMVGSTVLTVKEGQEVKRGQEFGYFKFGGSTIVLVFQKDRLAFDHDILDNSRAAIETLVRVGMGIGRAVSPS